MLRYATLSLLFLSLIVKPVCFAQSTRGTPPGLGVPVNSQPIFGIDPLSQAAAGARYESCAELIASYGEDWQKIKAALQELVANSTNPSPVKDAEILRKVRFTRLPANYSRAVESFYLICEVQALGGKQVYRIQMATAELAAWADVSPRSTLRFAPLAFGGQMPPRSPGSVAAGTAGGAGGGPPPPPVLNGDNDGDNDGDKLDPVRLYELIRPALIQAIRPMLDEDNEEKRKRLSSTFGDRGQLQEIVIQNVERRMKRTLSQKERELVWSLWLQGKTVEEICAQLPPKLSSSSKLPLDNEPVTLPQRNPPPSERACVKTYASFCGKSVKDLLMLNSTQLATCRDRIETWTTRYDLDAKVATTNMLENVSRRALSSGMSSYQVRLYGDYLLLRALANERSWDSLVATQASVVRDRGIEIQSVERDQADYATHFTSGSLQNLIVLYGILGSLNSSDANVISATKQLLDSYDELLPYFELISVQGDGVTDSTGAVASLFSPIYRFAASNPSKFTGNDSVERDEIGLRIQLEGRDCLKYVRFDRNGNFMYVESEE